MATKTTIGEQINVAQTRPAPDWSDSAYLNFAGRTVNHADIVNMTNMDVARNSTMLSFAKIAGPIARYIPIPAVKAIGYAATAMSYGYDTYRLFRRMNDNKSNDAFWTEYNDAVKVVQAQDDTQRIATDFAIGSNLGSGQSLPANVKPIGEIAGGLGQMAQYVALGVLGGTKTFIFGGSISNALNEANTRMGYGEEQGAAIKAGVARGIASGVTSSLFLAAMPALVMRAGGESIDAGIRTGFWSHPATNFAMRGTEFMGWGAVDPYALNVSRTVMGLDPEPIEFHPGMTAGMFALGGFLSGGLMKKSYSFTGLRRMKSTGDKEYMNFSEMAAAKKSALKAVNETVGVRYFGDITTPERQSELMNIQAGKELKQKEIKGTPIQGPLTKVQERLLEAESGVRPFGKTVEQIILENHGVSKKLTTPTALEKVGGPEAALRLSTNDEETISRAMSELSTANRLIQQSKDYDISAQTFTAERTGGKVTDTFIPDAEGVARKVRIVKKKYLTHDEMRFAVDKTKSEIGTEISFIRFGEPVEKSTDWSNNEILKGMSVYEINAQGASKQTVRSEFSERKSVYVGKGTVVGYGSDGEPLVSNYIVRKASKATAEKAEYYGYTRKQYLKNVEMSKQVPSHIKKSVGLGSAAIVSGLIYTNLGNDQWDIRETQWLTPAVASRIAEMARNEYRISRDRQGSITKAMNVLTDDYALNPDNYKMVYDRFMKLTGGYA